MSTLTDDTDYQLEETEMILRKLDSPLYNIIKGIPWIAQKWPEIQRYLLKVNIYLMGEAYLESPLSREISFEPDSAQKRESEETEDDISQHGQGAQEEEYICNDKHASHTIRKTSIAMKGKNSEDKVKSRSTSIVDTMTGGRPSKVIYVFDTLKRQKSPTTGRAKCHSASQTMETSRPYHMHSVPHTEKKTTRDGDPDHADDPSGEESDYVDDDRRPARHRRPDKEEEAKETEKSVLEITPSMKE